MVTFRAEIAPELVEGDLLLRPAWVTATGLSNGPLDRTKRRNSVFDLVWAAHEPLASHTIGYAEVRSAEKSDH